MRIKSARYFREKYMTDIRHIQPNSGYNPDFIGCVYQDPSGGFVKGFFDMYHGDKQDIGGFLSGNLKIAEDGQAIYEFMQNAADCGSTSFYMFYNDDYFLAVNNGKPFTQEGLRSLLNVGQSDKKSASQIGRFGIGFKLVHRLVGKSDGKHELLHDNKGPIMFSWSKKEDLLALLNKEEITAVNDIEDGSNLPYFLKLILTNFPADPNETVKDLNYSDTVLFTDGEYTELAGQTRLWLEKYLEDSTFNQGTLFFIKLGEGKRELLDKDYKENLKTGVEYSLNTLKNLKNIKINDVQIDEVTLKLENGVISKDSEDFVRVSPEYADSDIHYSIGYNVIDFNAEKPFLRVDALKESPTFYKYFPLGDEIHHSALFIHCDSLSNEANRRKLHDDSTNRELIPLIARFVISRLESMKNAGDMENFKQLYANLLLSETPHDNSNWLKGAFYDIIREYIRTCVPTSTDSFADNSNVFVRKIKCNVPLSVVNSSYQWFMWNPEDSLRSLTSAAKDKLGIKEYDIVDLLAEADANALNEWLVNADEQSYDSFVSELNSPLLTNNNKAKANLRKLKLFRFSDGSFRSYTEVVTAQTTRTSWQTRTDYLYSVENPYVFTTAKTLDMNNILMSLGFQVSELNLDDYQYIKQCLTLPKDLQVFGIISLKVKNGTLSSSQKKELILHLTTSDQSKKLENVGDESIKKLCICKTEKGELKALCDMVGRAYMTPLWLSAYRIDSADYFHELDKFLIQEKEVYAKVILPFWENMQFTQDVEAVYNDIIRLYLLDEQNNRSMRGKAFVYTEDGKFETVDKVRFNMAMLDMTVSYASIKNVMASVFGYAVPKKSVTGILQKQPFGLTESRLCDLTPLKVSVTSGDIASYIKVCKIYNEAFFNFYVVEKENDEFYISRKSATHYQVYSSNNTVKAFIEKNNSGSMVLLPTELSQFSDEQGILKGEDLYGSILKGVNDVDALQTDLVDVLKYDSRRDFILKLSEIDFDLDKVVTKEDYDYKIMEMACSSLEEKDYEAFRSKVVLKKNGVSFSHDQIPSTLAESVSVTGAKKNFDLAMLLPQENGNGALLNELVDKYAVLGISRLKLNSLFGISSEANLDEIYDTIKSNYPVIENDQQLAFMMLMDANNNKQIGYKAICANGSEEVNPFVVKDFSFIKRSYTLAAQYAELGQYMALPYGKNQIIQEPYIDEENVLIVPGIDTKNDQSEYDQQKVLDFLAFLMKLKKQDLIKFQSVKWSVYKDNLSFDPDESIYPEDYAILSEALPDYIEKWASANPENLALLSDMGVQTENDVPVRFRKYMVGKLDEFDAHSLYSVNNKSYLENSLKWIAEKCIFPLTEEKYKAVMIAIEQINKLRGNNSGIIITDKINLEELSDESIQYAEKGYEEWKEESGYSIYLYDGELPHTITIDEYIDEVIYCYHEGNITDDKSSVIYVNGKVDLQKAMHQLAADNKINLTTEDVYKLFDRSISDLRREIEKLRNENAVLRTGAPAPSGEDVSMKGDNPNDVDYDERPEYNEVARKKVMKRLMGEGYKFTQGHGDFSIIPGVIDPEGNPAPLVVKSCRWGKIYISPMEWGALLMPNSMLWVFDGNEVLPLQLRALIRNQEKLVLSMDTRNLDDVNKVSKFAQILQYFKQVNFEFNSVRPTTIASTYKQYAFDDRPMDEKPSADEFE